jgi:hypothetical protein
MTGEYSANVSVVFGAAKLILEYKLYLAGPKASCPCSAGSVSRARQARKARSKAWCSCACRGPV